MHLWLKNWTPCASYRPRLTHKKESPVNIKPETREILRQYMTCQCAVFIGGHFILQGGKGR
ncbi:TPA: hypothetical protein K8C06_002647 [Salmonella enterica subsp. enterica serovar Welikade]|nr:hypothetical protein [Salmonella enterica subsp. enterica serovar Welikade]